MYNVNQAGPGFMFNLFMTGGMKSKKRNQIKNAQSFTNINQLLINLALNTFEWEGLPDTVDPWFFEMALLNNGAAAIGKDPELGFIGLPFSRSDKVTIYGDTNTIKLYGQNGYNKEFTTYIPYSDNEGADAVRCFDNPTAYPYMSYIFEASERISETLRSIDAATKKLKNPYFLVGDKSKEREFRKLMQDLSENHDAIMLTEGLDLNTILNVESIAFDVSIVTALWEQFQRYDNNIKETLGITNNENIDKDERLLVDEVNSNNRSTNMNLDLRLRKRLEFCDQINEHFGLNVSVKLRYQEFEKEFGTEVESEQVKEDDEDETI